MQIKLIIYAIIGTLLLAMIGGATWYYHWSQEEIKILRENNVKLEFAVKENEKTIQAAKEDSKKSAATLVETNKKFDAARKENNKLKDKLSKHELGYLAIRHPALVEKSINHGTKDAGRCFEILSGAPLSDAEKSATKKSEANTICPDIANPSYKAIK